MLKKTCEFMPWMIIFVFCSSVCSLPARAQSNAHPPSRQEMLEYAREVLAFPQTVELHVGPIRDLPFADFYDATVTANSSASATTKTFNVALSRDREFFIAGDLYKVNADFRRSAIAEIRQTLKVPPGMQLSIGAPSRGLYSAFYKVPVVLRNGTREVSTNIYLTSDRRTLVVGLIFPVRALPRPAILKSISLTNTPSQGLNGAPITIVEFADLQCPECAQAHEFLENVLIPRYKSKIQIFYKEFPIIAIHDWAWTAAIASKCVYEIRPEAYVGYRSLVFQEQSKITAVNARRALLDAGKTIGINEAELGACIASPRPKSLVEQDIQEGKLLEISTTPTFVVNERIVVGMPNKAYLYKVLDAALSHKQSETVLSSKAGCHVDAPCKLTVKSKIKTSRTPGLPPGN